MTESMPRNALARTFWALWGKLWWLFGIVLGVEQEPIDFRDYFKGDGELYESLAYELILNGVQPDGDAREPWFLCAALSAQDEVAFVGLQEHGDALLTALHERPGLVLCERGAIAGVDIGGSAPGTRDWISPIARRAARSNSKSRARTPPFAPRGRPENAPSDRSRSTDSDLQNPTLTAVGPGRRLRRFPPPSRGEATQPHSQEARHMFSEHVAPRISAAATKDSYQINLRTYGLAESPIAESLSGLDAQYPDVTLAYRAERPMVDVKILARSPNYAEARQRAEAVARDVVGVGRLRRPYLAKLEGEGVLGVEHERARTALDRAGELLPPRQRPGGGVPPSCSARRRAGAGGAWGVRAVRRLGLDRLLESMLANPAVMDTRIIPG